MYPVDSFLCLALVPLSDPFAHPGARSLVPHWVCRDELMHLGFADEMKAYVGMPESTQQERLAKVNQKGLAKHGEPPEPEEICEHDIMNAVRLILPGELAKHAVSEGIKAVTKFSSSSAVQPNSTEPQRFGQMAGLCFPVPTIAYDASRFSGRSMNIGAAVWLSAVCECVLHFC